MKQTALITGITGQDGSYLAELLLEKDYDVFGLIRRKSQTESELGNVSHLQSEIEFIYGDVTDSISVRRAVDASEPNEVYNLAGQTHVGLSFEIPEYTFRVNALGTLNLLEAVRSQNKEIRFYQAGTSELFGNQHIIEGGFHENTPMCPVSPYGTAKLSAHLLVQNYRSAYNMFASNGILFNHESPRRGASFVTQKIVNTAVQIQMGNQDNLTLGNLKVSRDWGHAKDYVKAMWMMLQADSPDDFVVATGKASTLEKVIDYVFYRMDLDWKIYIKQDDKYFRPNEVLMLKGNSAKIRKALNWAPEYSLESLLDDMITAARKRYDRNLYR